MPLGTEVGLDPGDSVLDGNPASFPPKVHSPQQFSAYTCCGHMAGWIKMLLGTEVGLGPGHIVLDGDGDAAPFPQRGTALNFGPCLLWPKGWMDQDATWYGGRHCVR